MKKQLITLILLTISIFSCAMADDGQYNDPQYDTLLRQNFALSPSQIVKLKNVVAEHQKATEASPGVSYDGQRRNLSISINPTNTKEPPMILINKNKISSIIFTDQQGNVWPIKSYTIGDSNDFQVIWTKGSGVMLIKGLESFKDTNMAVTMANLPAPLMINLATGQRKWDYKDYIKIEAMQHGGVVKSISAAPAYLESLLNGLPPESATELNIQTSSDAKLWQYNGSYLLLTPDTLISPKWTSKASRKTDSSPMNAYSLSKTPFIVLSDKNSVTHTVLVKS